MQVITIGKPAPWPAARQEGARAQLTDSFLQILCYLDQPSPREVKLFRTAPVRYGVFEAGPGLPFVLSDVGGIKFDTSINLRRPGSAEAEQQAMSWPQLAGTLLSYVLVDWHSNVVMAMRLFNADTRFTEAVRWSTAQQLQRYQADAEIDEALARAEGIPLAAMLHRTIMYQYGQK